LAIANWLSLTNETKAETFVRRCAVVQSARGRRPR
jgi:hypothetical protein